MKITSKQKKDLKFIAKEFEKTESRKKEREYISKEEIKGLSLKELYNLNCKYIEETDIMINVKKRPIKGGIFEYSAIGYNFIEFLNSIKAIPSHQKIK